jgi:hypothetical protein
MTHGGVIPRTASTPVTVQLTLDAFDAMHLSTSAMSSHHFIAQLERFEATDNGKSTEKQVRRALRRYIDMPVHNNVSH